MFLGTLATLGRFCLFGVWDSGGFEATGIAPRQAQPVSTKTPNKANAQLKKPEGQRLPKIGNPSFEGGIPCRKLYF